MPDDPTRGAFAPTVSAPRPVTPTTVLAAELIDLCDRLDAGTGTDPEVVAAARRARDLAVGLDDYVAACTSPETSALAGLARRTHEHDWDADEHAVHLEQEMLSGHVEGRFLAFLVHMTGARRILELGMFTGYSALAMAEAAGPGAVVVASEIDPAVAGFAAESFEQSGMADRIDVRVGPASELLRDLAASCAAGDTAPFDLVFVDADKGGYAGYLDALLDSDLLADGAVVAVDNTLMQGQPYRDGVPSTSNGTAIATFNASVADDPRVEQVLVPLRDGVTLIRRTGDPRS
ncbi:O-methyltransferase [Williamsia deligens]|uniref:O-methyltransferase n=1 Tax=Williamsia deligens TaxID=321325 RepID=A0ABW3G9M5_9NOCA|nr:class I SAM-dependent methyltransferase [Williamsia deligens]MCP2195945.1 caffeoyl-CoA O-methyltransferase [Williamsia deligens]